MNYINFVMKGVTKMKATTYQLLVAYHLIRGTISSNSVSQFVNDLKTSPHLKDFKPIDILPLLKPLKGGSPEFPKDYRGARMLGIVAVPGKNKAKSWTLGTGIKIIFTFSVHYCLRLKTVERDYESLRQLHETLKGESLTIPEFPEMDMFEMIGMTTASQVSIGQRFANYLMRIYEMAVDQGKFSPRLLRYLDIDFEKVQSEEEGAIMAILDTLTSPRLTVWHIIDEKWLTKWRRFAMGRGPRRYLPPGPITNAEILEESKKEGKKTLKISKDYRCVNYNAWRFLELVHGGGPCIGRKEEDIYSAKSFSYLEAIIMIQGRMRIYIANAKVRI